MFLVARKLPLLLSPLAYFRVGDETQWNPGRHAYDLMRYSRIPQSFIQATTLWYSRSWTDTS